MSQFTFAEKTTTSHWLLTRNHLSGLDTLVNQDDHAVLIRSLFLGEQVYQNQGVCRQAFPHSSQHPLLHQIFALVPI